MPATFPSLRTFPTAATFPVPDDVLSLLNVQKLSLPLNTPLATQVAVSDGFYVVSGVTAANAFYALAGTQDGKHYYIIPGHDAATFDEFSVHWDAAAGDNGAWRIHGVASALYYTSEDQVDEPWEVENWQEGGDGDPLLPTLTHPALQQLAPSSTAQGGVFVSGGTQDGVWVDQGTSNGKRFYSFLGSGVTIDQLLNNIDWDTANFANHRWVIWDNTGTDLYYSLSDVAIPDLASNWKNASDDSPASISLTSVTQGQLGAGLRIGTDTFVVNGSQDGRLKYSDVLGIAQDIYYGLQWRDADHNIYNNGNVAFPFLGTPEVTVDRDDVANEANWVPTTP